MPNEKKTGRYVFFILFAASGFSGLIYESIWSHYLQLFLGHAAYAQTLVLIIYMGGMALGAWAVGKFTTKIKNLLKWYALTEGLIGLLAIIFHPVFTAVTDTTYASIIPHMDIALLVNIVKWTFAGLLILPQSVLLGATFPLMSGGVIRRCPLKPGQSLSLLYFTNSLGAAVGVLVSGFLLVESFGLPGTILTAGIINIILSIIVFTLSKEKEKGKTKDKIREEIHTNPSASQGKLLPWGTVTVFMLAAAFTGTASFMYEIGWIRMLSLVLGSSSHAFELMLSAFILGLAVGGYWISRKIDKLQNPVKTLGYIQLVMGALALLTLISYGQTFHLMGYAVKEFPKTGQGYLLFNLFSHGLAMLLMVPTTICAGMTLPLITYYLFSKGSGESAIGKIYGANTVGSILGIILAIHFVMPVLGVKNVVTIGAAIDILLGILLLRCTLSAVGKLQWKVITAVFTIMVLLSVFVIRLNPVKMASGVYRHGKVETEGKILFHMDGKTASVDLIEFPSLEALSIATNGKSDAAISYSSTPRPDELTMVLLAALPMAVREDARRAANIGLGSGLTSHVLLANPNMEKVDTIEIERAMAEGARGFGERVKNVYEDPRSTIHFEDAKTFFYNQKKPYDIIISEPSNPWISGISGLFSMEFYRMIKGFLTEKGIFCQWVHLYDMDIPLVASIVKALSASFDDYHIYFANDTNLLILAGKQKIPVQPGEKVFAIPGVRSELARIGIFSSQDLWVRKLGTKKVLDALFHSYAVPANSDYYPVLGSGAAKARYLGSSAEGLNRLFSIDCPLLGVLEGEKPPVRSFYSAYPFGFWQATGAREARAIYQYFISMKNPKFVPTVAMSNRNFEMVKEMVSGKGDFNVLQELVYATLTYLSREEMELIWNLMETSALYNAQPEGLKIVLKMYKALSSGDFGEAARISTSFLPEGMIESNERNDFLLKVALLSHIASGNRKTAGKIWDRFVYKSIDALPLELRLLGSLLNKIPCAR
jgi:spermidine synthase